MGQQLGLVAVVTPFIVAGILITIGDVSEGGRNKLWIGAALLFVGLGLAGGGTMKGLGNAAMLGLVLAAIGVYLMYNGYNDKEGQ